MSYTPNDEIIRKRGVTIGRVRVMDYLKSYNTKSLTGSRQLLSADSTREERIRYYTDRASRRLPLFSEITKEGFSYNEFF